MERLLENCAYSALSALNAQIGGADRVELCSGMAEGGTTPSYGEIVAARKVLTSARLHVIIRPRGGDFLYDDIELETMLNDIKMAKSIGADGIVLGCLTADGSIDTANLKILLKAAEGMSTTFHRAFDVTADPYQAMETLIVCGADRVLTSGMQSKAIEGTLLIKELQQRYGSQIEILAGSGVNAENAETLIKETGISQVHSSCKSFLQDPTTARGNVSYAYLSKEHESDYDVVDAEKVRALVKAVCH